LRQHPPQLTKGVEQLIDLLHQRGKVVYLVSGGFRQMIEPVADSLRIPIHRIYANNLLFSNTAEGSFEGFDTNELTSRDGGKPAVLNRLIALYGYESIVMIGDGVTDMVDYCIAVVMASISTVAVIDISSIWTCSKLGLQRSYSSASVVS